ncbi:SixA phosphatase family protein [Aliiglaciecola sp. M165]|uniref:SixA phosphatase family protein n=1 Tax=Aliiglaciecola sp. M165 TaxID=2593649 RepID=UPI00118034A9|nr:histidine phosphatase family protein [Aliiglaciecola sp. M165]TRY31499.1 phosphoglycerate mutase [Aliiglaciecola sp. M165]
MKTIHLIRHAKSSWDNPSLADIDRPLNARGIRACQIMAPHINAAGSVFNNVYCSPAVRAQSTIERIKKHLPDVELRWKTDQRLYSFSESDLIKWCRELEDSVSDVTLIGHNPALTDFCNALSGSEIENIPTCGYVQLIAKREAGWRDITAIPFELKAFLKPKALESGRN